MELIRRGFWHLFHLMKKAISFANVLFTTIKTMFNSCHFMSDVLFLVIYTVTVTYDLEFYAFFGCVGLFNAGFLFIYAAFDASRIMRWSTRHVLKVLQARPLILIS